MLDRGCYILLLFYGTDVYGVDWQDAGELWTDMTVICVGVLQD